MLGFVFFEVAEPLLLGLFLLLLHLFGFTLIIVLFISILLIKPIIIPLIVIVSSLFLLLTKVIIIRHHTTIHLIINHAIKSIEIVTLLLFNLVFLCLLDLRYLLMVVLLVILWSCLVGSLIRLVMI